MAKITVELDTEADKEVLALILRVLELLEKAPYSRKSGK
jgi:hypothetical protein|tara:strand:+ start:2069 stop:2185 length:117 start_codon:yes stop_codon:yes gene_type:complete